MIEAKWNGMTPAFPTGDDQAGGMTLREYVATHALAGLLATENAGECSIQACPAAAVGYADALLDALARTV